MGMFDVSTIRGGEEWSLDVVKSENLLGNRFVLRQKNRVRAGPGKGDAEQIDICDHVHFLGVVAVERFGQVENEIGIATRKRMQRLRTPVQFEVRGLVAEF